MRQITLLAALAIALLMGCQTDDSVVPSTDKQLNSTAEMTAVTLDESNANTFMTPAEGRRAEPVQRKLKIRGSGTISFGPPSCDPPAVADANIQGTGHATHLGLFSIELSYCLDANNDPITLPTGIQTAANGDQLFTQMIFTDVDPELGLFQDYIYDGGTGRFEDAEGYIRLYTEIDMVNLTYSNHGEGWLAY